MGSAESGKEAGRATARVRGGMTHHEPASATPHPSSMTVTLERGLRVLRAFRAERTPLTNVELVRRTGFSRSSVSRLTTTLIHLGYLRRVASGPELELAPAGFGIGHAYTMTNPVTQRVHPFMQELADRLQVSVALAVPDGLDMLYIAYRTSAQITALRLDVGSLLPMGVTAIGRAWLWALPPQQRKDYLAALLAAAGPDAQRLGQRIRDAFDQLEDTGACMAISEYQRNAYGIAVPLRAGRRDTLMAMNCGAAGLALDDAVSLRERIAPELKSAAREVVRLLRDVDAGP